MSYLHLSMLYNTLELRTIHALTYVIIAIFIASIFIFFSYDKSCIIIYSAQVKLSSVPLRTGF